MSVTVNPGVALRESALNSFEGMSTLETLRNVARRVALTREDRTASINDVRPVFDTMLDPGTPNILGAVFRGPDWEIVWNQEQQTQTPQGHARRVRVFRYIGGAK
jgi:hypothetical protein